MRAQELLSRIAQKRKTAPDNGPARRLYGLYPATCRDNNDPEKIGRIRMECALVWGVGMKNLSPWAWPKNMPMAGGHCHRNADGTVEVQGDMGAFLVPEEGSPVWVEFVAGDPSYPVYSTGYWGGSAEGRTSDTTVHASMVPLESKRLCPEQYPCFGDLPRTCLDCEDALEHGVTDSYDDIEHRPFHDHREGKFYCPRMRTIAKTETGHSILANDKDGRESFVMVDRAGQCLKFKGRILPELQVGTWADGTMRGNMLPRGERIMDRNTEGLEVEPDAPAEFPTAAAATALSVADLTQTAIADALDGLLTPAARAALQGTPLGNVLGMMDSATLGGVALTPSAVFEAFVGGATSAVQNAVTTAMAAVGTSPGALLAAITSTVGVVGALTGTAQTALAAVQSLLPDVFPTVLAPAVIASGFDGYDPRLYCVDQHASVELRDLARGFYRLETAAVLDEVEVEGASAAPAVASATALASLGLTQAGLVTLAAALSLPDVQKIMLDAGTELGAVLQKIGTLTLDGVTLTIDAVLNPFIHGMGPDVRNTITNLLSTVNLTPLGIINTFSSFTLTAPVLAALALVPGARPVMATLGSVGITALGATLMAIPGAGLLGGFLTAFGLLGFTSLFGFFPSLGIVIGEKVIIWRSDRDLMRHQSIVIDHATGQEKIIFSGLNLEGEQVGPQVIIDSTLGSRVTVVDPISGSFENLECSTGGTKEALYEGGRIVGTGFDDALFVGGDWLCMVGFPSPLSWREPIDVLPLLDEKAALAPQAVGGAVLPGTGNILHAALLTATRWAGLSIFDVATINYTRLVGGIDTINVGGAQLVTIGGAQVNTIGGARTSTIGLADVVTVGLTHTVTAAANIVHNSLLHIINAGAAASHYAVASYDIISAIIHLYGGSTPVTKATPYCVAVYGPETVECPLTGIIHPQPSVTVYATI